MAGPAWLVDSKRIATKIKNATGPTDSSRFKWISNPTKACPRCNHIIDNSDVVQEWPGLPQGVKFDPSDQELLGHLLAKIGIGNAKPHPFINEFIPTVEEDDGICYTHPQKLPGVKQDGSVSHFFHRTFKAYNTGTRKRRKINDELVDVRWHKTGKTKPVIIDGRHLGCKKIMVLYMSRIKGEKPEKTSWVMHQYHLGTGEDEKDGEYVISKIFYQQQAKPGDKSGQDLIMEALEAVDTELDPVPSKALSPENHGDNLVDVHIHEQTVTKAVSPEYHGDNLVNVHIPEQTVSKAVSPQFHGDNLYNREQTFDEVNTHHGVQDEQYNSHPSNEKLDDQNNHPPDDTKWWEGESQFLLDSQQLVENIAICEEFLQSQTSCDGEFKKSKPRLSDYARMGVEYLKRDLEECQTLADQSNIELDTPPDFRLSQLEFGSQDSFLAWAGSKLAD